MQKAGNTNTKLVVMLAGGIVALLVVVGLVLVGLFAGNQPGSNATTGGGDNSVLIVGNWTQSSPTGFPLATSATQQGQTINFMKDGTLDMGGDTAQWKMVDGSHLSYSLGGYNFILTMVLNNDNKRLTITGTTVGTPRVIVLERQ